MLYELGAFFLYFSCILLIGATVYKKKISSSDFILGNRSLNYFVTALAAHASDMSGWLFMAFPSMIFLYGVEKIWIAVGLTLCMFLNWHFIARKVRVATEKSGSLTFFSYLGDHFKDDSGSLRLTAAALCSFFYILYVSVGLMALGILLESLFPISYEMATLLSILVTLPYVLIGGYRTLAWIDLFQGLFLMAIIIFVPCFIFGKIGGFAGIQEAALLRSATLLSFPSFSVQTTLQIIGVMLGWGLGYFGQPTIITKFMGIKHASEITKSQIIGMSWMVLSLGAAVLVGLVGIAFFQKGIENPEMIFIEIVKTSFHPFFIGLMLCAIIAACMNVMSSQILVLCSTFTEDIYKRTFKKEASSKELLLVSRLSTLGISFIAFLIAYYRINTVYELVLYAWSGLGASFGPILIYSLYSKKTSTSIAWAGILSGGISSALWPWINKKLCLPIDPILIGFAASFLSIWITAGLIQAKKEKVLS